MDEIPADAKPVILSCPHCQQRTMYMRIKLVTSPAGTYSLAGAQPKVTARQGIFLVCQSCGANTEGHLDPDSEHATFDLTQMTTGKGCRE